MAVRHYVAAMSTKTLTFRPDLAVRRYLATVAVAFSCRTVISWDKGDGGVRHYLATRRRTGFGDAALRRASRLMPAAGASFVSSSSRMRLPERVGSRETRWGRCRRHDARREYEAMTTPGQIKRRVGATTRRPRDTAPWRNSLRGCRISTPLRWSPQ